ncbi:hypothetical protein V6N12_028100 [Hibiscus sabdariffa]|uniref:Acyl-CoA dehydrogenase/oxidase C-terminal domain-containing protein n=1 Tax=Hibiscus sabdariffa TaxID=183260 RepID=A0ABR2F4X2_9ROSI
MCRLELEQASSLVLQSAHRLIRLGNKKVPLMWNMTLKVLGMAIQAHGGAGVSSDIVLAHLWTATRTLRITVGADEAINYIVLSSLNYLNIVNSKS